MKEPKDIQNIHNHKNVEIDENPVEIGKTEARNLEVKISAFMMIVIAIILLCVGVMALSFILI